MERGLHSRSLLVGVHEEDAFGRDLSCGLISEFWGLSLRSVWDEDGKQ